jgi:hypothetical protein
VVDLHVLIPSVQNVLGQRVYQEHLGS